jgi:hypothetical protein
MRQKRQNAPNRDILPSPICPLPSAIWLLTIGYWLSKTENLNKIAARWKIPPTDLPNIYRDCDGHSARQPRRAPKPVRAAQLKSCNLQLYETRDDREDQMPPSVQSRETGRAAPTPPLPPSRPLRPLREVPGSVGPPPRHRQARQDKPGWAEFGEIKSNWAENNNQLPRRPQDTHKSRHRRAAPPRGATT